MGFYSSKKDIYNIGIVDNDSYTSAIPASATTTVVNNAGTGLFYNLTVITVSKADVDDLQPQIKLDGNPLLTVGIGGNPFSFADYNSTKMATATSYPVRLLEFNADGVCILNVFYPTGLPFNTSCVFTVRNPDADAHSIYYNMVTTLI